MLIRESIIDRLKLFTKIEIWFLLFASISFILAFNKIVLSIGFSVIPIFFLLFGFISYLINSRISLYLFVFLLPIITAFPYFSPNGFPYNYMAIVMFYFSGILIASFLKKDELRFKNSWGKYYLFFLLFLWISALFIFLRWSNITYSSLSFLKNTPVEPGGTRSSFASIFPILTLFFFSISQYLPILLKRHKLNREKIFYFLLPGYIISVLISLIQMFIEPFFMKMKMKYWEEGVTQFSGGFSDFNSFGFFSGVVFLSFVMFLVNYLNNKKDCVERKKITFYLGGIIFSLIGIFVSGSRAAFIFVIASMFLFFFSMQVKKSIKISILIIILLFGVVGGGVLKDRVVDTFEKLTKSFSSDNFIKSLDKASNGRIMMFQNSAEVLKKYSIAGIGTGNFLFYLKNLKYKQKYYEDLPLNHYLLIFDEIGFIGLFAFLLFLFVLIKNYSNRSYLVLLITIYIVLFVNNYFWFPENLMIFWIIVSFGEKDSTDFIAVSKWKKNFGLGLIIIFIITNLIYFKQLHPVYLNTVKKVSYNYGFWYPEKDNDGNVYSWSKGESGVYLVLSKEGISQKIKVFCGAPLTYLKDKRQNLEVFWKGKLFKKVSFKENKVFVFEIKDKPECEGFLEFRVSPMFNPKKLGLSGETRNLGIQIFL